MLSFIYDFYVCSEYQFSSNFIYFINDKTSNNEHECILEVNLVYSVI